MRVCGRNPVDMQNDIELSRTKLEELEKKIEKAPTQSYATMLAETGHCVDTCTVIATAYKSYAHWGTVITQFGKYLDLNSKLM